MSRQVTFDYSKAGSFISQEEIGYMKKLTLDAKDVLVSKSGAGNDFLGWIDLPVDYDKEEFERIKKAANKIITDCKVELKDLSYKDMSNEEFLYKDYMFYSRGGEYFFREDDVSVVYLDGFIFHLDDKNLIFSNNFREVL